MVQRSGAEVLAEMLQGYSVTHMFMVPSILRRTLAEMERRSERSGASRSTPRSRPPIWPTATRGPQARPGICMAQVVGALNLAAGLRDAWLAHAPVIAMTGGRDPHTKFREAYQDLDDVPAFEQVTKFQRDGGRDNPPPRYGAPGLSCRRVGQTRPGSSAVPGQ